LIAALCGREPEIRFQPPRVGEIAHSCGDRSLIRARFALPDPVDLRLGLAATLAWLGGHAPKKGLGFS
jgi:UDP-glucose 4-epimerase